MDPSIVSYLEVIVILLTIAAGIFGTAFDTTRKETGGIKPAGWGAIGFILLSGIFLIIIKFSEIRNKELAALKENEALKKQQAEKEKLDSLRRRDEDYQKRSIHNLTVLEHNSKNSLNKLGLISKDSRLAINKLGIITDQQMVSLRKTESVNENIIRGQHSLLPIKSVIINISFNGKDNELIQNYIDVVGLARRLMIESYVEKWDHDVRIMPSDTMVYDMQPLKLQKTYTFLEGANNRLSNILDDFKFSIKKDQNTIVRFNINLSSMFTSAMYSDRWDIKSNKHLDVFVNVHENKVTFAIKILEPDLYNKSKFISVLDLRNACIELRCSPYRVYSNSLFNSSCFNLDYIFLNYGDPITKDLYFPFDISNKFYESIYGREEVYYRRLISENEVL